MRINVFIIKKDNKKAKNLHKVTNYNYNQKNYHINIYLQKN